MVDLYRFIVVALFFAVVFAYTLGWSVRFLFRKIIIRKPKQSPPSSVFRLVLHRSILGISVIGMGCIAWGFAEPYFPKLETVRLVTNKRTTPLRIVQISDLHCDPKVRAEDKVIGMINALKPDLIAFTGDGVNSDAGIPVFRRTMRSLSKIAPTFGVRGNWEAWWFTHVDTFKGTGMTELDGHAHSLDVAGERVWLGGTAVDDEGHLGRALNAMPKRDFRIALHHYPAACAHMDGRVDLLLTGDTHGGQIQIPLLGPLIRIRRWRAPYYLPGLHYTKRGMPYYVNRGIGMEGHHVPRVRFRAPPEVTLIEVLPKK